MCTIIVGDVNTSLSILVRKYRRKITKKVGDLNYSINLVNLVDLTGTSHNSSRIHLFLSVHGILFRIDYILVYKMSQKI